MDCGGCGLLYASSLLLVDEVDRTRVSDRDPLNIVLFRLLATAIYSATGRRAKLLVSSSNFTNDV